MKNRGKRIGMWLLALLPLLLVAILYTHLPDRVPMHWGLDGMVDRYGGKHELWLVAALGPLFALLFQFLPRMDPKKRSYEKFQRVYETIALLILGFLDIIMGTVLVEILRPGTLSIGRVIAALVGLLFVLLGNLMGKLKPNFFLGIRTPWTLSDPDVWNRSHRLGGALFVLTGLVTLFSALLLPEAVTFWVLMSGVLLIVLITTVMSYLWYRQRKEP